MYKEKPYRLWAGSEDDYLGLECLFWPECCHCEEKMEFWAAKPIRFSINDGDDIPRSHAIDIEVRCPKCGLWEPFGVAVSKEHWENVIKFGRTHPNKRILRPKQVPGILI